MLVLVYTNEDDNALRLKTRRYYLQKGIMYNNNNNNVIINEKKTLNLAIDLGINDTNNFENQEHVKVNVPLLDIV